MRLIFIYLSFIICFSSSHAQSSLIVIKGANGVSIKFAGVWEAWPNGLWAAVEPGRAIFIPWEKFDLADMDIRNNRISTAMLSSQQNQWDEPLNLGIYGAIITPLQAARLAKKTLCRPIEFSIPLQYVVKIRDQISSYGNFNFSAQFDRRTGSITGQGNFSWESTRDVSASVTQVRPSSITSNLMALLTYSSYGDKEKKEVFGIIYSNPGQIEKVMDELRVIINAIQLYPAEQLPGNISASKARIAQSSIAQGGKELGWLNRQIDNLDQITLTTAIKTLIDSLEHATKDTSRVDSAFSNMKYLITVLERPFAR